MGGQDRLDIRQSTLSGNTLAQVDGGQGEPVQGLGQTAEVGLPIVRRSSRQRSQITSYQVGTRDSRTRSSSRTVSRSLTVPRSLTGSSSLLVKWAGYVTNDQ